MLDKIHLHPLFSIYKVYLAQDTRLNRRVALKVLPPGMDDDPQRLARFRTEAEAAAQLNHPNIAQIYSVEETGVRREESEAQPSHPREEADPDVGARRAVTGDGGPSIRASGPTREPFGDPTHFFHKTIKRLQ